MVAVTKNTNFFNWPLLH